MDIPLEEYFSMPTYPSAARRLVRFASRPLNPSLRLILAFHLDVFYWRPRVRANSRRRR